MSTKENLLHDQCNKLNYRNFYTIKILQIKLLKLELKLFAWVTLLIKKKKLKSQFKGGLGRKILRWELQKCKKKKLKDFCNLKVINAEWQ